MAQARKPLSALRTFGAMLQLRVARSDPSSDMATGVVIQACALCMSFLVRTGCAALYYVHVICPQTWHLLSKFCYQLC
jgi:hypothetical protein